MMKDKLYKTTNTASAQRP